MVKTTNCPHPRWEAQISQEDFEPHKIEDVVSMLESAKIFCPGCKAIGVLDADFYNKLAAALKTKAKNMPK